MTLQEMADKLGVNRKTITRWRDNGTLEEKLNNVPCPTMSHDVTPQNVPSKTTNNWERNKNPLTGKKYKDKYDALATAVTMVLESVKGSTIVFGGELMESK